MTNATKKVTLNHNGISNKNLTVNSISLTIASDENFSEVIETKTISSPSISPSTAGSIDFVPTSGEWATGKYYKITINVTNSKDSNYGLDVTSIVFYKAGGPSCTISPTTYDFGGITVGQSANHSFTVTTSNLTGDLTLTPSTGFTVNPASIASTATSTNVTVTCTPTAVGEMDGTLTISGGGLTSDVVATLSATGLCAAPATELEYTTPIALTLTGDDVSTTLVPTENTGNGGTITYELVAGDENHAIVDENTGEFTADAVGSYTVRATQALNGTTCGGTFDIVINVTGTNPTCTIDPTEWDFENVAVGTPIEKTFTVVTANLTSDLTLSMFDGTNFSVSPTAIEQSATSTQITVTCAATEAGELEDLLTISGGGLTDEVDVELNATGYLTYTVTYSAVNGDAPAVAVVAQGSPITLGTVTNVDCSVWSFAGWSETDGSTTAPTLLAGTQYTPTSNITLYAVYARTTGSGTIDYTLAYDTWTYSGTTTDKSSYRLFGDGAYIESAESHDLSKVTDVKITMRTFGGTSYKNVNIEDASGNVWGNAVASGSTMAEITATKTGNLTGNGKLRIKSKSGNGTGNGVGIEKVIYTIDNTSYAYSTNPSCAELVATPTISPNGGIFFGSVEISLGCETEGATISYTTDNWETTNTYNEPFTITETAIVKAKANKSEMSESNEASATFTKTPRLETIQDIFNAATTQEVQHYVLFNNYVVSGVSGSTAYVTNGTQGFIIYKYGHGFAEGDILNGTIQAKLKLYNGSAEFTDITASTTGLTVTHDGTITPQTASISDLGGINTGAPIIVNNVTYNSSSQTLTDASDNEIKPITTLYSYTFENNQKYNVTGIYLQYSDTKEIMPRKVEDIQIVVEAPTFDPAGGDYNAAQTVTITSATPNATIYYTLDGTDPTSESSEYSTPLEIGETTTIKAFAVKEGVSSGISTATYTITITTVATPTITESQYFNENIEVTLDCATDGATIVYTTDNWGTSTTYTEPFTLTETTTVKAKATKSGMDDSEIAEATYTKRYKVSYVVNGDGTLFEAVYVTPTEAIGTLPTPTAANIPNGYVFRGWSANEVALTDDEPTYVTAATVPEADMNLKAVFAIASTNEEITPKTFVLTKDDFNKSSYADNNGSHTKDGISYYTNQVMQSNSSIQFQKNAGYIYNVTAMKVNSISITKTGGSFTVYEGTATNPTSTEANVNENIYTFKNNADKYFTIKVGNATGNITNITVNYEGVTSETTYSNFCTSVNALSGNLAEAETSANTAYYINAAAYVPANETATINGVLGNANASLLVINDGAQLILNNAGVMATAKKHIEKSGTSKDSDTYWYTISSPLAANTTLTNVTNLIPAAGVTATDYDLYRLNEAEGIWENSRKWQNDEPNTTIIANPDFTTIDKGIGYIYANTSATTDIAFAGAINVEDVECSLTNGAANGFNLIGNPFMQNIALTDVVSQGEAELASGFYVLNHNNSWGTKIESGNIAPLQGFLVQATTAGKVTISKPSASKGERSEQNANIEIIVSNGNYSDNAYVMFSDGIGLNKINHRNADAPMVYIPQNGEDFAIAMMDESTVLFPVNFKAMTTGYYTISLKSSQIYEGYNDFDYLHLIDNMTGEEIDMLLEDGYKFVGSPRDNEGRFTVKLHRNGVEENEVEIVNFVYQNGNSLVISGEGTFQLIDMLGRVVISKEVHGETVSVDNLITGAYIVRMIGNEVKTQKIVIK